MSAVHLVAPGAGHDVGGGMVRKLLSASTRGQICIFEAVVPPGDFVPPHVHTREDEITLVLAGRLNVVVGEEHFVAEAGAYVVKPRDVMHAFWNADEGPARVVEVVTPGTFDDYFGGLFALAADPGLTAQARRAAIDEHQRRYGITFDLVRAAALAGAHGLRGPA